MKKVLAIIPARGGSKGIHKKNITSLLGRPLIEYTIQAAKESSLIDKTIVSTDSEEIKQIAERLGCEAPFLRPDELSGDNTPALPVVQHAVKYCENNECFKPSHIVLLQPTSPLRESRHIDEAINKFIESDADSIVSVVQVPHNYSPCSVMKFENDYLVPYEKYDELKNLRQVKPTYYARNGAAIYAFTYECVMKKNSLYGNKIIAYEMNKESSIDIDDPFDLKICEFILKSKL